MDFAGDADIGMPIGAEFKVMLEIIMHVAARADGYRGIAVVPIYMGIAVSPFGPVYF